MEPKIGLNPKGGAYMTIDFSQLDLKGEFVKIQSVGWQNLDAAYFT
jgi:hypothetical protein